MRIAVPSDRPALTALWTSCFGDASAVVESFFDTVWDNVTVFVTDDVSAMLTAMPVRWQDKSAAYIYAVATDPDHRGKGLCNALMAYAEDFLRSRGFSYAILSPAEESLFRFYEKMGYQTSFYCQRSDFQKNLSSLSVFAVSPEAYAELRKRFAPDGVEYPEYLLRLQESAGQLLKIGDIGCAAVEQYVSKTFAAELLATDEAVAASSLCHYLNLPSLSVKLPGKTPYGMAKSLDGSPLQNAWLGLAFE